MEAQGCNVTDNVIEQDNRASISLENNGKASSSKRTKHINIRFFFVTDRIAKGEVRVEWCPTLEMIGDCMTKPLQGALFRKPRDLIMGVHLAEKASTAKMKGTSLTPSKSKERRHRSVLEQTADPASLNEIPAKKSLRERKRDTLSNSHSNGQFGDRAWKLLKETPKKQEKKTT